MAQTKQHRNARGRSIMHNPSFSLPGMTKGKSMAAKKNSKTKGRKKSRRRNSAPAKSARVTATRSTAAKRNPAKATNNPKRGRRKSSKRGRRNPFRASLRNPQGAFSFLVAAAAAGVGNEVFNALASKLLPGTLGPYARAGIKIGAAYFIRKNKTVDKFTGGNADGVAMVIAALAAAEVIRPYIAGPLNSLTGFLPQLPAGNGAAQGAAGLVNYNPNGLGGLVNVPQSSGFFR